MIMMRYRFLISSFSMLVVSGGASAQTWEPVTPLPTAGETRAHAVGVSHQGMLYAIGGTPWQNLGDMDGSVHRLPSGGGAWENVSPLGGMGPIIGQAAGVDALGRIVVYGGYILGDNGPGPVAEYEPIDGPTGTIADRNAPETATGYTAFATDEQGRLYGMGGGFGVGVPNSGYCDRYTAATNTWEVLAPLPTPVTDSCAAFDGNGHILVCGGINATGTDRTANVAQYDIASGTWSDTAIPDMPVALSGARAARGIDDRIYVVGGVSGLLGAGTTQSTVYKWEPATNVWVVVSTMATPRRHFALVLGDDDYIYAIGGDNDTGGTDLVERLFTPRCPSFDNEPVDQTSWSGTIAGFGGAVSGAAPITYQWRRDGQPLVDGPTGSGSTIVGATAATLTISAPDLADEATYDVVATNACGSTLSAPAVLTIRQTPEVPTQWLVTNLHPAWAQLSSRASGVSNGRIGGEGVTPTVLPDGRTFNLAHPVLWTGPTWQQSDITPAGSVGGSIRDVCGDYLVGWYWHTYSCPGGGQTWTCAWQSAAYWTGNPLTFTEALHNSGPEYDSANGTDGQHVVGTLTYEYSVGNYSSRAVMWTPPGSALSMHPNGTASDSFANAVDGGYQYGSINTSAVGGTNHAAMWAGSASSFIDLHPAGFSRSWIVGAADGQAVGTAVMGAATNHAIMWISGGSAVMDLTPAGQSGDAVDAHGGLQVGNVGGSAAIWAGTPESWFDLNTVLPAEYSGATAEAIEVAADGTVLVVGSGYVPSRNRTEAIMWQSLPTTLIPGDANCDGTVDTNDLPVFVQVLIGTDTDPCHTSAADMTGDGSSDGEDVQLFVGALVGP